MFPAIQYILGVQAKYSPQSLAIVALIDIACCNLHGKNSMQAVLMNMLAKNGRNHD